jgi:hypothetical protein
MLLRSCRLVRRRRCGFRPIRRHERLLMYDHRALCDGSWSLTGRNLTGDTHLGNHHSYIPCERTDPLSDLLADWLSLLDCIRMCDVGNENDASDSCWKVGGGLPRLCCCQSRMIRASGHGMGRYIAGMGYSFALLRIVM